MVNENENINRINSVLPFDVLLAKEEYLDKWAVIACDQYTSEKEYWQDIDSHVKDAPSALRCIIPEALLNDFDERAVALRAETMQEYLKEDIFRHFPDSYVYVERELADGNIREGLVGVVDLECYEYRNDREALIKATEGIVAERIPARLKIREASLLEMSHVILYCDDEEKQLIEPLKLKKDKLVKIYDLPLYPGNSRIRGWLINKEEAEALHALFDDYTVAYGRLPAFCVGDGNHSLVAAKLNYENLKKNSDDQKKIIRARYVTVEVENIQSAPQEFKPICRLLKKVDTEEVKAYLKKHFETADGEKIEYYVKGSAGTFAVYKDRGIALKQLQDALDDYLKEYSGEIDYIHGTDTLKKMAQNENCVGFIAPTIGKDNLFTAVSKEGLLPRKAFSIGEASDKRYYLETREL